MAKHAIETISEKNRIADNIIQRLVEAENFLMLGHENPDEDCIAAMVSFALLVSKFDKKATLFVSGKVHEHLHYLIKICQHNAIRVVRDDGVDVSAIDTIVVCDTPKPAMVAATDEIQRLLSDQTVATIEFDHHIAADSAYIGQPQYAMVTEASSACELIGYLALKLRHHTEILEEFRITELFARNFVLAVLTGIIGDSKMGRFLKSRKEQRFYGIFSGMFNELLAAKTTTNGNFSNKEEVYTALMQLSATEEECHNLLMSQATLTDSIGYVILDEEASRLLFRTFDVETIVSVARSAADTLAEQSMKLSLIGYVDFATPEGLVQFRLRRSHVFKSFDVRKILDRFNITNGGGHEGAIGFRFSRDEVPDIVEYSKSLIAGIESEVSGSPA